MLKNLFYLLLITVFISGFTLAQDGAKKETTVKPDSTEDNMSWDDWDKSEDSDLNEEDWNDDDESSWMNFDFDKDNWAGWTKSTKRPAFTLLYGLADLDLDKMLGEFAKPNLLQFKIGYITTTDGCDEEAFLVDYKYSFLYLTNTSTKLSNKDEMNGDIRTNIWAFGFGNEEGIGYKFGNSSVTPYIGSSLSWTRVSRKDSPRDSLSTWMLDRYEDSFRFGQTSTAGLRISVIPQIAIDASYEKGLVFPRTLFWKWAGSGIIEVVANSLLDNFIDEIRDNAPVAAPIVNILLKGALNYGLYELRSEKMNWPFESYAPLTHDQFKIGMTFTF